MSRDLRYSDDAREHLDAISSFIEENADARVADGFIAAIVTKCEKLSSLPGMLGTARADLAQDVRSTPFKGYILYFRYDAETLEILGVLDARRDAMAYFADDDVDL